MALRLDHRWVWDCWFAVEGDAIHAFYLQAARALGDPERRHWNVSIGHAVSRDLRNWTVLPDALAPAPPGGRADSLTTWTGSIIRHANYWHLFYTGTSRRDDGRIQRICHATSTDLQHWTRDAVTDIAPLDPRWYETYDPDCWHDQSWRDPWVMRDPDTGRFHMFITARVSAGPADGRGAIAHAVSDDLIDWQVRPPVLAPGGFGEMEVPQVFELAGRWYLICSVSARFHSKSRLADPGLVANTGTLYLVGDSITGPWREPVEPFLIGDRVGSLYAGRVVDTPAHGPVLVAFRNLDCNGSFIGELSDPMPIESLPDGRLRLKPNGC